MAEPREEDWTFRTLKLYADQAITGLKALMDQRFAALAQALEVALKAMEARLSLLNEIRGALSDQNAKFAIKEDTDRRFEEQRARLDRIDNALAEGRGSKTSWSAGGSLLIAIIGLMLTAAVVGLGVLTFMRPT